MYFAVLGIKPTISYVLGKHSTTVVIPRPISLYLFFKLRWNFAIFLSLVFNSWAQVMPLPQPPIQQQGATKPGKICHFLYLEEDKNSTDNLVPECYTREL